MLTSPITESKFCRTIAPLQDSDMRLNSLFTVKDGLILINVPGARDHDGENMRATEDEPSYVFADINGDDWFYFEDTTTSSDSAESCEKSHSKNRAGESGITATTVSGSDTTLINFKYKRTPGHKVLHEGRCNFAGLASGDNSNQD